MVFLRNMYLVLSISISLFLMMMMNIVLAGPTGLSLKLIHRDSPESPLYPGRNLTRLERMERSFQRTKARHQQMTAASMSSSVRNNNNTYGISPNAIHPPLYFYHDDYEYIVELGIGTFNPSHEEEVDYKIYYLIIDTGSSILWLQCEECEVCFPQDEPPFPWKTSTTYRPLPCDNLCPSGECLKHDDPCSYSVLYADGTNTTGVFATETLTVNGDDGVNIYKMKNFIFGCGLKQLNFEYGGREKGRNPIAGILGLGGGTESFLRQLGDRGSEVKFEYCLVLWTDDNSLTGTYLRFGSDTRIGGGGGGGGQIVQTTPLYFMRGSTAYYAVLIDISVGGTRIGYHEGELEVDNNGSGGCIFDTGSPFSALSTKVYDPLKAHLIQYLADLGIHTHDPGELRKMYELCFERPNAFDNFPKITFHFDVPTDETKSADLEIETEAAFYIERDFFCFNILRNDDVFKSVILGGIQQANHRMLFDVENGQISWSKEKCVGGS